jgi:hypothetical protein
MSHHLRHPKHTYHAIHVGHIPHHKVMKMLKTGTLNLTADELAGNQHQLHLHPETHAKAHRAKRARKGVRIHMTSHEIHHNAMHGSGLFDSIKSFWNDNGSKILDSVAAVGKVIAPEFAPAIDVGRKLAKNITGKGVHKSPEEVHKQRLANLAKARAARKHVHGGSFAAAGY